MTAPDANTLAVFVTGGNNALYYQKWQSSGGWQGWQNLGGNLATSPAAAARSSSAIDVVVRGSNGTPYERSTTNSGSTWGGWQKLSGTLADGMGPALTARAGALDLFVTGSNRALYHLTWGSSGWSTSWEKLDGYLTSSPAVTSRSSTTMDVFVCGSSGIIYERSYNSGWAAWIKI